MDIKDSRAYKYAVWASGGDNHAVGRYVRRQAQSWLSIADGNVPEAYVDEREYEKIIKLLGLMIHPDLQKPMPEALEDYAMLFITALFCTKAADTFFV